MKRKKAPLEKTAHIVMIILSLMAILPFVLLIMSSVTDDGALIRDGYSFFPKVFSLDAYRYIWEKRAVIIRGYGITILVTIVGMSLHLAMASMLGYVLSRKDFPLRGILSFYVFFTMLFNGGLVPTYLMYNSLGIKNTLFGLLVPLLLLNAFHVILMRSYFTANIPEAVIEAAIVDGAGKFKAFTAVVLPMSYPILATVGLFAGINYWNDWYNGMIYLTDANLFSLQNILNRILTEVQFLSNTTLGNGVQVTQELPTVSIRMAIAVIAIVPIMAAYPFFQKYFVKGIALGAVKG